MSGGRLLTPAEQIEHLKSKGISFDICSEQKALHFLNEHTYLTKVSAYRKNYQKYPAGPNIGLYQHLDFAYLIELSTIDMHLRYLIITLCLDIEHAIKVSLINDMIKNPDEDGYGIIDIFIQGERDFLNKTSRKVLQSYCRDFYYHNEDHLPIWVVFEVISFGDLIKLYKIYFDVYRDKRTAPVDPRLLDHVRNIRNAAAHSNCLIDNINRAAMSTSPVISNLLASQNWLTKSLRKKYLRKMFTLDFSALLITHKTIVKSEGSHTNAVKSLRCLFFKRMLRHRDYFMKNDVIVGAYSYCAKLLLNYFI